MHPNTCRHENKIYVLYFTVLFSVPLWGFVCLFQAEAFLVARYVWELLAHKKDDERYFQITSAVTDGCSVIRNWKAVITFKQYSSAYLFTCHDAHKDICYYKDCINTGKKANGTQTNARAKSFRPLHFRIFRADVKLSQTSPHTIWDLVPISACFVFGSVKFKSRTELLTPRLKVFVSSSLFLDKHQVISLWEPSIIASRLPVHTGFHMDFCACAHSWTPLWCCALSIGWNIFIILLHDVSEIDASPSFFWLLAVKSLF